MSKQLEEAARKALKALEAHDLWHAEHDDHDGYPESDLSAQSLAARQAVVTVLAVLREEYAELEREHLGDPDKRTGIYAQPAPGAAWANPIGVDFTGGGAAGLACHKRRNEACKCERMAALCDGAGPANVSKYAPKTNTSEGHVHVADMMRTPNNGTFFNSTAAGLALPPGKYRLCVVKEGK